MLLFFFVLCSHDVYIIYFVRLDLVNLRSLASLCIVLILLLQFQFKSTSQSG